ncbi:nicotianamine synthase family protein [Paenibacillus sp. NEAU-GSW1]|uniref:nicotianamine synthase family protein n=1 Tax=Paenibacillus sp. NEAU-GSW1 TaxID=2682486 RepID=UPI0012E11BD5|nr:nicotianamine synthase family protein [Paenibacillus sp. NEAU-GSW1]MUT68240.1 hypothetical protein [Paenibacillus sp. NEAU-GSW1]
MEAYSAGSIIQTGNASKIQSVDQFIAFIRDANELLQKESDLSPANRTVTNIISRLSLQLRSRYMPEEVQAVLSNEYVRKNQQKLRDSLSEAEFLAELSDSWQIRKSDGSVTDILSTLPYWNIYTALVSEELSMLRQIVRQDRSTDPIVFVGSGPMPLSPIILHLFSNMEVVCLEMDADAYDASVSLLEHLGLGNKVTVVMTNGSEFDYRSYNRIFVASLVRNKQAVLERIRRTSLDPLVAVRTAEGMKQIMYEAIDESLLKNEGWRIVARTSPDENLVINSTLFLNKLGYASSK